MQKLLEFESGLLAEASGNGSRAEIDENIVGTKPERTMNIRRTSLAME